MIIKECYIENFGVLHQVLKKFDDKINILLEENGWGKTTFADFIKTMFYGMDSKKAKGSLREKYSPWNGGKYGGYIIFEAKGKLYRIERFFALKEKDDTFCLYDEKTGEISSDYSKNIGYELFEIDKESFSKSAYIPQGKTEITIEKTGEISAKLTHLTDVDNDLKNYDQAIAGIDQAVGIYKKRGGGKIKDLSSSIASLEDEIRLLSNERKVFDKLKEDCDEKKNAALTLKNKLEKAKKEQFLIERKKQYLMQKEEIEDTKKRILDKKALLKKQPDKNDIDNISLLTENYKLLLSKSKMEALSEEESKEFAVLDEKYKNTLISEDDYADIKSKIYSYESLLEKTSLEKDSEEREKKPFILSSIGIVFLLISMFLCAFNLVAGIIVGSITSIFLVSLAINHFSLKKRKEYEKSIDLMNKEKHNKEIEKLKEEIISSSKKYIEEIDEISRLKYSLEEHYKGQFDYFRLQNKHKLYENTICELNSSYNSLSDVAHSFCDVNPEECKDFIKGLMYEITSDENQLSSLQNKLSAYENQENELMNNEFEKIDVEETEEKLNLKLSEILNIEKDMEIIRENLSRIPDLTEELENNKKSLENANHKLLILEKTKEALSSAKENLDMKYLGKIRENFSKYSNMLKTPEGAKVDSGFKISLVSNGQIHSSENFSQGTRELLAIALRFSLIEALFEKEHPTIILDDPFVNLDEVRLPLAMDFVKNVSNDFQIIYFTCHSDRT